MSAALREETVTSVYGTIVRVRYYDGGLVRIAHWPDTPDQVDEVVTEAEAEAMFQRGELRR